MFQEVQIEKAERVIWILIDILRNVENIAEEINQCHVKLCYLAYRRDRNLIEDPFEDRIKRLAFITGDEDIAGGVDIPVSHAYDNNYSRADMVAFMIERYNFYRYLHLCACVLSGITNVPMNDTMQNLLTEIYFMASEIQLFRGLEPAADEFVCALIERRNRVGYGVSSYIGPRVYSGRYIFAVEKAVDSYFKDAEAHLKGENS